MGYRVLFPAFSDRVGAFALWRAKPYDLVCESAEKALSENSSIILC